MSLDNAPRPLGRDWFEGMDPDLFSLSSNSDNLPILEPHFIDDSRIPVVLRYRTATEADMPGMKALDSSDIRRDARFALWRESLETFPDLTILAENPITRDVVGMVRLVIHQLWPPILEKKPASFLLPYLHQANAVISDLPGGASVQIGNRPLLATARLSELGRFLGVYDLKVHPDYRRAGVATQLMEMAAFQGARLKARAIAEERELSTFFYVGLDLPTYQWWHGMLSGRDKRRLAIRNGQPNASSQWQYTIDVLQGAVADPSLSLFAPWIDKGEREGRVDFFKRFCLLNQEQRPAVGVNWTAVAESLAQHPYVQHSL